MNALEGKVTLDHRRERRSGQLRHGSVSGRRRESRRRVALHSGQRFSHPEFTAMPAELSSGEAARKLAAAMCRRASDASTRWCTSWAASPADKSVAETDDATFEKMLDLNYRAAFYHRACGAAAHAAAGQRPDPGGGEPPGGRAGGDGGRLQRFESGAGFA